MGCHTNFYIPANLTYEQAKKLAVIELNRMLEQNERYNLYLCDFVLLNNLFIY